MYETDFFLPDIKGGFEGVCGPERKSDRNRTGVHC